MEYLSVLNPFKISIHERKSATDVWAEVSSQKGLTDVRFEISWNPIGWSQAWQAQSLAAACLSIFTFAYVGIVVLLCETCSFA